jgi:hypothetical protein
MPIAIPFGANSAIFVFQHLEEDWIAEVLVRELAANQIDESVLVSSGFKCPLDMENESSGLVRYVLCAFWPAHASI